MILNIAVEEMQILIFYEHFKNDNRHFNGFSNSKQSSWKVMVLLVLLPTVP